MSDYATWRPGFCRRRSSSLERIYRADDLATEELLTEHRESDEAPVASGHVRRNSTPALHYCVSQEARDLGSYIEDELACSLAGDKNCNGATEVADILLNRLEAIILPVRDDLALYELDLTKHQRKKIHTDTRAFLSSLEHRVSCIRDRLLYPFHCQQVMDLSHICGCLHALRMRLGLILNSTSSRV